MTIYRINRLSELQRNLERFADEEAELEQIAKDLDTCSKHREAEVRLRTKGLSLVEQENSEEAREYVHNLLQQLVKATEDRKRKKEYVLTKIKRVAKGTAVATAVLGMFAFAGLGVEKRWNANEYALEALAKYDTPAKINDIDERTEVISQLAEIFKEHAIKYESYPAAGLYLKNLESKGYTINEGAIILHTVGYNLNDDYYSAMRLQEDSLKALDFITTNKLEGQKIKCLFDLAKTVYPGGMETVKQLHAEGYCKKE